jgi:uncharacterized protein
VRFDLFTIALLTLREDAPQLDEAAGAALQDAHLAWNADQHDAGNLLAAGPIPGERYRGLSVWAVEPERVQALRTGDPAVRAGRLAAKVVRWMAPGGAVAFSRTRLPRSTGEVERGEVELDRHTLVLLTLRPDAPVMDEAQRAALQDAHLAYNAEQHEAGHMLAAGPLHDEELRGLSIWALNADQVRPICETDPSVRAGRLAPRVMPWMVPAGAVSFSAAHFPRNMAEAAYE